MDEEQRAGQGYYKVVAGETLLTVSVKTGVPLSRLRNLNRATLAGSEHVWPGLIVRLTAPHRLASTAPIMSASSSSGSKGAEVSVTGVGVEDTTTPPTLRTRFSLTGLSDALQQSFATSESGTTPGSGGAEKHHSPIPPPPSIVLQAASLPSLPPQPPPTKTSETGTTGTTRPLLQPQPPLPDPILLGKNPLLTVQHAIQLRKNLPVQLQIENFVMLYSSMADGSDFSTFYRKVRGVAYTLLVVRSVKSEIFGGFAGAEWKPTKDNYYGCGESFLFKVNSDAVEGDKVQAFKWSTFNSFFQFSTMESVAMGGEGDGFGFVLDGDFLTGSSNHCRTYLNPVLTTEPGVIRISAVEVWGWSRHLRKVSRGSGSPR